MKKLSPAIKGLITAMVMITVSLLMDSSKAIFNPTVQYIAYGIYAVGIIWTLLSFINSATGNVSFRDLFSQGFKAFIIIVIAMVAFTGIFVKTHPEFAAQEAVATREYYQKNNKDRTAKEIEDLAARAKKQYTVTVISIAIFRYLIIGALLTAVSAAILNRRR